MEINQKDGPFDSLLSPDELELFGQLPIWRRLLQGVSNLSLDMERNMGWLDSYFMYVDKVTPKVFEEKPSASYFYATVGNSAKDHDVVMRRRTVIHLLLLEGLSIKEVGILLSINPDRVRQLNSSFMARVSMVVRMQLNGHLNYLGYPYEPDKRWEPTLKRAREFLLLNLSYVGAASSYCSINFEDIKTDVGKLVQYARNVNAHTELQTSTNYIN